MRSHEPARKQGPACPEPSLPRNANSPVSGAIKGAVLGWRPWPGDADDAKKHREAPLENVPLNVSEISSFISFSVCLCKVQSLWVRLGNGEEARSVHPERPLLAKLPRRVH